MTMRVRFYLSQTRHWTRHCSTVFLHFASLVVLDLCEIQILVMAALH